MLDMGSEGCCLIGTQIPTHKRAMLPLVDKHASRTRMENSSHEGLCHLPISGQHQIWIES